MTSHYGHYKETKHPVAARIWGHRLRTGQHWMEYMLEFLSVLSGFKYQLGQGLAERAHEADYQQEYRVPTRLGLRRFVFYDERERARDPRDSLAVAELRQRLQLLVQRNGGHGEDLLDQVRSLLRSFSAVEKNRSWFAKTLFPVHESFLLWEGQRARASRAAPPAQLQLADLDEGLEFTTRNFFARGGELYYLLVSAGTEGRPDLRAAIGDKIKRLLTQHNQTLGQIAEAIDSTWSTISALDQPPQTTGVGWILDPACALYRQLADDLDTFLDNHLDSLECLELLAHLIGFQIISYIYHRAHPASNADLHDAGSCLELCRPTLLIDLLGEQDGGVVRSQSAALFREQDDLQLRRARAFVAQKVREWHGLYAGQDDALAQVAEEAELFFQLGQTRSKGKYAAALREIAAAYAATDNGAAQQMERYAETLFEALHNEFRKNFLGVHRKIGLAIGLVAPRTGAQLRFVLGDTLLKTLVLATLAPDAPPLPFGLFLEQLYVSYGLVIGPGEARASGLIGRLRINEEYYARNRDALLNRMQRAGLVTQYSDATALVRRPGAAAGGSR